MRDLLIIAGVSIVAICIGVLLFFFGPPSLQSDMISTLSSDQTASTTVAFTVVETGTNALSISPRTNYRITTENDLKALWPLIYGVRNAPPLPVVDFSKYEILALFDGVHATKGFTVTVASVEDGAQVRVIKIVHGTQTTSCKQSPGISSPFEIIKVPKTSLVLEHIDSASIIPCAPN